MADLYEKAGVSQSKGDDFVDSIKSIVDSTKTAGVLGDIGAFGGMFEIPSGYKEPVLVSSTDGVGTKVLLAIEMNKHDTIGIDCVAMNVDDIICSGAKPLYFLDYIALGKLNKRVAYDIVNGVVEGCKQSGCSLIGGETAQMGDMYAENEYDLVGFAVGIVEKSKIIDGSSVCDGDVIIGLPSSGLHSNGYTLARKVLLENYKLDSTFPGIPHLGMAMLEPTTIYAPYILKMISVVDVHGIAHITGGGLIDNIPRAIQSGTAIIDKKLIQIPPIIDLFTREADMDVESAYRTFNMGIGMVVIVPKKYANKTFALYPGARIIGRIEGDCKPSVDIV
jgi:phosphoribosylformylglycinamidine cyclo-ligase